MADRYLVVLKPRALGPTSLTMAYMRYFSRVRHGFGTVHNPVEDLLQSRRSAMIDLALLGLV